jgi:hypothetical protein
VAEPGPLLSWPLILAGSAVVWWLAVRLVAWLMGPGGDPRAAGPAALQDLRADRLCACRAYAFCHDEPRWFDAAGVRHEPGRCQPLRKAA